MAVNLHDPYTVTITKTSSYVTRQIFFFMYIILMGGGLAWYKKELMEDFAMQQLELNAL